MPTWRPARRISAPPSPTARRWCGRCAAGVSGLSQPTYVLDIPGGHGKVPVGPDYVAWLAEDGRHGEIDDAAGCRHAYPPNP